MTDSLRAAAEAGLVTIKIVETLTGIVWRGFEAPERALHTAAWWTNQGIPCRVVNSMMGGRGVGGRAGLHLGRDATVADCAVEPEEVE